MVTHKAVDKFDEIAADAGVNVAAAKAELAKLDTAFGGQHGDIPEQALDNWINAHFDSVRTRAILRHIGRAWEAEIAEGLDPDRKKERSMSHAEWAKERERKANKAAKEA